MNLLGNAIQAIQEEGEISIETSENEESLIITIHDNGPSIPLEELSHLFDCYFVAKQSHKKIGTDCSFHVYLPKKVIYPHVK
jgi:signal transduction histidine kinase